MQEPNFPHVYYPKGFQNHLAYHFVHGGYGIKPFMDMYVIKNNVAYDEETVRKYCRQCKIEDFYDNVLYLTEVWFEGKPHTDISLQMEEYVLKCGAYGTLENKVIVAQAKQGNKVKYFISRIFLPYDSLKVLYPVLKKHKYLLPIMQVRRWIGLIFGGKLKRSVRELSINQSVSKAQVSDAKLFLEKIGL